MASEKSEKKPGDGKGKPVKKERREFSAGFVIFRLTADGPRFLLLDYGRHWDYAKGHLEEGESAWKAAVRELREETGIKQVDRVGKFQKEMHYEFRSPKKGKVNKTVTYFLGRTNAEKVALSDEHTGYAWLPYEEAVERLTYENAKEMLRAAWEELQKERESLG